MGVTGGAWRLPEGGMDSSVGVFARDAVGRSGDASQSVICLALS